MLDLGRIIEFSDEETVYALIETDEEPSNLEKYLEEYRDSNELDYEIDGFLDWLKKDKKVKFKQIPTESDFTIYF